MKLRKMSFLATLVLVLAVISPTGSANTPSSTAYVFDYQASNQHRDEVHRLLLQAHQAYIDWNMSDLEKSLKSAYALAPGRLDILYSIAATQVWDSQMDMAMATYDEILKKAPDDLDALTYQALYSQALGHQENPSFLSLKKNNPHRAADLTQLFTTVENVLRTPVVDTLPAGFKTDKPVAIVTLGFALEEQGSMAQTLLDRLNKTLEVAKALPDAKIIVTGGVPKNGKNEGIEMKRWLIAKGIRSERIIDENYARDTVENMIYSRYILSEMGVKDIVIIS